MTAAALLICVTVACSGKPQRTVAEPGADDAAPTDVLTTPAASLPTPTAVASPTATCCPPTSTPIPDSSVGPEWESVGEGTWIAEEGTFRETAGRAVDSRLVTRGPADPNRAGVDVQWFGGLAGLVARYRDKDNWVMAWVLDCGRQVVAAELTGGIFIERGRADYAWGDPGTIRRLEIVDDGISMAIHVDGARVFQFAAPSQSGAARAGLFNRANDRNTFANFSNVPVEKADPTATPVQSEDPGDVRPEATATATVLPEAPPGWRIIRGTWSIAGDDTTPARYAIEERSGEDTDNRLITSAENPDVLIQVRVVSASGAGGIVASYADEQNWLMAWCNPLGHIVVGQSIDGSYGELARVSVDCGASSGHRLSVRRNGSLFRVLSEGAMIAEVSSAHFAEYTDIGLFARGPGVEFRDFALSESPALFSMPQAITVADRPGVVPFGMLSDPTTDFGIDGPFLFRGEIAHESIVSGYPFGRVARKFRIAGQTPSPDLEAKLNTFAVTTGAGRQDLTFATRWGRSPDGQRNGWVGWADDGAGNPTHIARSHASDGLLTVDSTVFTRDGAVTYLWDIENLRDLEVAYGWTTGGGSIVDARVMHTRGHDVAILETSANAWWLAAVAAGGTRRTIGATLTSAHSASMVLNFTDVDPGGSRLSITVGWSGNSLEEAIERALSGATIQSAEQRLSAATDSWFDLQSGARFPDSITEEDEWFVRGILNHVASHSFEAPEGHWYVIPSNGGVNQHAWLRDASVTALGVARFHPEMAADMIDWMADQPSAADVLGVEWFHYDGTSGTNESSNIDSIAWLALAMGRVFNALPQSDRAEFALNVRGLVDQVYEYVLARWDSAEGHIDISPHGQHDWWDNRARLQDTAIGGRQFKFEMGSEVIFASALRLLAPAYETLGAVSRAGDFAFWGAELESHLEDYELPGRGGLSPAIDVNGDLVDAPDMIYVWGNVKAAAFLGRRASYDALAASQDVLRRPGLAFFSLQQSYYDANRGRKQNSSNLFEWLIAGVDARWGSGELNRQMRSLFHLPWSPRDHWTSGGNLYIPNMLSYMMTAAFQLESVRLWYEPEPLHHALQAPGE